MIMDLNERIEVFAVLGDSLREFLPGTGERSQPQHGLLEEAITKSAEANPWFTREFTDYCLKAWSENLVREKIRNWIEPYREQLQNPGKAKRVAVIMAGNVPLVGFHDFLSVLISGNQFTGRLSSDDSFLLPAIAQILTGYFPGLAERIRFTGGKLTGFDAVIATGSNNSSNYFEYYFSKYPHIIRKNRNGIAILNGEENDQELSGLADDIFLYFGMGCRSVSKLYIPAGYDFTRLFRAFQKYDHVGRHHKWMSNHDYYRSIFALNAIPALDNGFILLTQNTLIASPPAVLYFEFYENREDLIAGLSLKQDEIQIVVSAAEITLPYCLPGQAQRPRLNDYSDGIDTLQFLNRFPE
jgi:hypothetical protein